MKGHSFEREVAIKFRRIFPDAKRHLEYQASEANGVDIDNTGPFRIQCKRGKRYASVNAIDEVVLDPILGGIPLLVTKADKRPSRVVIDLDQFLEILEHSFRP